MALWKLKRPQSLIGIGSLLGGLGYFLAEVFSGGIPMNWPFSVGIWVSIGLIVVGAILILWGLMKDETQIEAIRHKYSKAHKIVPYLKSMDRRLWNIVNDYQIKGVDQQKFQQCANKVNQMMSVTTGNLDPNQSVKEWIEETKQSFIDGKRQVAELIKNSDFEKQHQLMLSITRITDDEGFGLKSDRQRDRTYKRYKQKVEKYIDENTNVVDSWISYMSRYHIHKSEYFANSYYVIKCTHWIIKHGQTPELKDLVDPETQVQLSDIENSSNERLEEIRVAIGDHIKELEKQEWKLILGVNQIIEKESIK